MVKSPGFPLDSLLFCWETLGLWGMDGLASAVSQKSVVPE